MKKLIFYFSILVIIFLYNIFYIPPFSKNSVVIYPRGDIGQKMFQYAAAYSLAKQTQSELYILKDTQDEFNLGNVSYGYREKLYFWAHGLIYSFRSKEFKNEGGNLDHKFFSVVNDKNLFDFQKKKNDKILILNDEFESHIYFEGYEKEIIDLFSKMLIPNAEPKTTCLDLTHNSEIPDIYFEKSLNLISKLIDSKKIYVLKDKASDNRLDKFISGSHEYINYKSQSELLSILANCKNNIIGNSSLAWWGSYLNKSMGLIIAPYPRHESEYFTQNYARDNHLRYTKRSLNSNLAYPKEWVMLEYNYQDIESLVKEITKTADEANEILKDYKQREFYIYSGDLRQLEVCQGKEFYQNLCFMNSNEKKGTVVSAYYQIKSKYPSQSYLEWGQRFLKLPFNLVIFTDKQNAGWIRKARGDLPMILIEKEFKDLYHYKYLAEYQKMYESDSNKSHSPELYIIWADKVKFVQEAIDKNPYGSNLFFWTDFGSFREEKHFDPNFPDNKYVIHDKMSFSILRDFIKRDFKRKPMKIDSIRIMGAYQAGNIISWRIYDILWDEIRQNMMKNDIPTRDDQHVMANICINYPSVINLIYNDPRYKDNFWLYYLYYHANKRL